MAQRLAAASGGQLAIVYSYFTVYEHDVETLRILVRLGEGRFIFHTRGIEDHQVRGHAGAD